MSLKKSPLLLLGLFIFGTSRLLFGIPMDEKPLLSDQKSSVAAEQAARRQSEFSQESKDPEVEIGGTESAGAARGSISRILETDSAVPSVTPAHPQIAGWSLFDILRYSHLFSPFAGLVASLQQSEKEPLLLQSKVNSSGYGSAVDHEIKSLVSQEEAVPDCWSRITSCFDHLFGSAKIEEVELEAVEARREAVEVRPEVAEVRSEAVRGSSFLERNTGIQNTGVDCYLNSALQMLKAVFLSCSDIQKANVITNLAASPSLVSFLRGTLDTRIEENARGLRKDILVLLANNEGLSREDRGNINQNGSSRDQADPIDFLRVLLPHLDNSTMRREVKMRSTTIFGLEKAQAEKRARLILENNHTIVTDFRNEREAVTAAGNKIVDLHLSVTRADQTNLFPMLECSLDKDKYDYCMQSLIEGNVVEMRKAFFDESIEQGYKEFCSPMQASGELVPDPREFYNDILIEEKIANPPPSSLVITIARLHANYATEPPIKEKVVTPVDCLWEPVVLAGHDEGRDVDYTYVPTSIICHLGNATGGHYVCYRKNGDDWFLFNDKNVEKINLDDRPYRNYSHKDLIMQNACAISYELKNEAL